MSEQYPVLSGAEPFYALAKDDEHSVGPAHFRRADAHHRFL
ncbi:hypothetical protein [Geobacillus sp. ZGt-1]|nr:hypothetical protein [Geobacillus sp. ZGt-1]